MDYSKVLRELMEESIASIRKLKQIESSDKIELKITKLSELVYICKNHIQNIDKYSVTEISDIINYSNIELHSIENYLNKLARKG